MVTPPEADAVLRGALARSHMRDTAQRRSVYRYLCGTDAHPTVQEIHNATAQAGETVSLATVYKTLEALVECGLVMRLVFEDGPARYDARTDDHGHTRCLRCGAIRDIPGNGVQEILDAHSRAVGFLSTHVRLEVSGVCEECLLRLPCRGCIFAGSCRSMATCAGPPHSPGSPPPPGASP